MRNVIMRRWSTFLLWWLLAAIMANALHNALHYILSDYNLIIPVGLVTFGISLMLLVVYTLKANKMKTSTEEDVRALMLLTSAMMTVQLFLTSVMNFKMLDKVLVVYTSVTSTFNHILFITDTVFWLLWSSFISLGLLVVLIFED